VRAVKVFFLLTIACLLTAIALGPEHADKQGWPLACAFLFCNVGMIAYIAAPKGKP
jgi:hypothetical protein